MLAVSCAAAGRITDVFGTIDRKAPEVVSYRLESSGLFTISYDEDVTIEEALIGANVVMGLRIQRERQKSGLFPSLAEYTAEFGITADRLYGICENALVMHPGPVNRGVEIAGDVADGPNSVINKQVTNGVAVRMAVMDLLIGGR